MATWQIADLSGGSSSAPAGGGEGDDLSENGELQGGRLVTTTDSVLVGDVADTSGSLAFADLIALPDTEVPAAWFRDLDLKGTVEWAC